jgi:hypothetical protein
MDLLSHSHLEQFVGLTTSVLLLIDTWLGSKTVGNIAVLTSSPSHSFLFDIVDVTETRRENRQSVITVVEIRMTLCQLLRRTWTTRPIPIINGASDIFLCLSIFYFWRLFCSTNGINEKSVQIFSRKTSHFWGPRRTWEDIKMYLKEIRCEDVD